MKTGRNDPCPCGSGKKYKHCCYAKDSVKHELPPDEPEAEAGADTDEIENDAVDSDRHEHHRHPKDRNRFEGEVRGGAASFRARKTRPSQRGT